MASFKVLEYNQISMGWVGIHSKRLTEPTNEFMNSFGTYYILGCIVFPFIISSAVFVYKYSSDFELVSEPLLIVIAGLQVFGMFISVGLNMKKIKVLHIVLQGIVDENTKSDIYNIYFKCEKECRRMTRIIACYPLMLMFVLALFYSFYCLMTGNLDTSTWILPYKLSVPFNTRTVHGWYWLWFVETNIGISYSFVTVTISTYFVCCCFYIAALCDHFAFLVDSLKEMTTTKNVQMNSKSKRIMTETISQAIVIHNQVFEIFRIVAEINSGVIFSLLPVNVIFLALTMYNTEHSSFDWVMLVFHVICIISSMCWPSLFCYYATFITNRISRIGEVAYYTNWYDYSPQFQKYQILIIARSQETIYFMGFNLIRCTLETLGKLCRTSCSYYILFRSISQH